MSDFLVLHKKVTFIYTYGSTKMFFIHQAQNTKSIYHIHTLFMYLCVVKWANKCIFLLINTPLVALSIANLTIKILLY